jgi:polysaccharide transporter, PST family
MAMNSEQQLGMRSRAAKGALFIGTAQIYRTALNFVTNIILARLLMPADFGLIAMVASCTAAVSLVQDLGLNQATIQRAQISLKQMSALFWLSVGSSITLAFVLAGFAPRVAWFFGEPRLTALTVGFAGVIALGGLQSQQLALMNREFRFKEMAAVDIISATAGAVAGLAVAWQTSSYWALFAMTLVTTLASVFSVWLLCSFRPGQPSFEGDFREIIGFGSGVSGFNIVNYFARNADNVLIGKFYGGEQLGYYDRAYRLLLFPITQILGPLGRVMLPVLARLQSDPERYRKAYVECISLLMAATQPSIVFMVVFAGDFIRILLGPHWLPAAPIFQWLAVCGLHQVVTSTFGWLFLSQGRGGDFFKIGAFNAIISVASFVVGLPWGGLGVAIAFTVVNYVLLLPVTWWWTGSRGPVRTGDLVSASLPHGIATVVSAVVLAVASRGLPTLGIATCFGLVVLSYGVYGLVMLLFSDKRLILSRGLKSFAEMLPSKVMR